QQEVLDARRVGVPLSTTRTWQDTYDRLLDLQTDARLALRGLREADSTEDAELHYRRGVIALDAMNEAVDGLARPDETRAVFARAASGSQADDALSRRFMATQRLVTGIELLMAEGDADDARGLATQLVRKLRGLAPGARGVGGRGFARVYNIPTIRSVHER